MKKTASAILLVALAVIASAVLMVFVVLDYSPAEIEAELAILGVTPAPAQNAFRANLQRTGDFGDQAIDETPGILWTSDFTQVFSHDLAPVISGGTAFFITGLNFPEMEARRSLSRIIFDEDATREEGAVGLAAVDARTGTTKWIYAFGEGSMPGPVPAVEVVDGTVFLPGVENGSFLALDAASGKRKWKASLNEPARQKYVFITSTPVVTDGTVYFGTSEGKLLAFDAATGAPKWQFQAGDWISGAPAFSEGVLFFGTAGDLKDPFVYAIEAATGEEIWRFQAGASVPAGPAVAGGLVFFGSHDRFFYAVDEKTGQERWRYQTGEAIRTSAAVSRGQAFITALDMQNFGNVVALDAATGQEKWNVRSERRFVSSPVVAGDLVYAANQDQTLHAFDVVSGREAWSLPVHGIGPSSPFFADGVMFTGGMNVTALGGDPG